MRVKQIRDIFLSDYKCSKFNNEGMLEIINASFIADEESIFGIPNIDYIKKELEWYISRSLSMLDIDNDYANIPKIWKKIASDNNKINSNYGWCIFSEDNCNQYTNVISKLSKNINSRQATMIYTRPSMHIDSIKDNMNDFICTNTVQIFIRDNYLYYIVNMRSNDAVFGYKNDLAWHVWVYQNLKFDLSKILNFTLIEYPIMWNANSLHIYPRHFKLIENGLYNE